VPASASVLARNFHNSRLNKLSIRADLQIGIAGADAEILKRVAGMFVTGRPS